MRLSSQLIYGLLFQIGWLVCVSFGDIKALVFSAGFIIFHISYCRFFQYPPKLIREFCWLILISLLGYSLDTFFFFAGIIYQDEPPGLFARFNFPPPWLFALWICFTIALRTCLSFIFRLPLLSYGLFAVAIPLSYWGGTYLNNNVHINKPYAISLILITLSWVMFMALLQQIKRSYFEDIFYDR